MKGNLRKETQSLLTAAQIKTIRTDYIKEKVDYTQENYKGTHMQ